MPRAHSIGEFPAEGFRVESGGGVDVVGNQLTPRERPGRDLLIQRRARGRLAESETDAGLVGDDRDHGAGAVGLGTGQA
jgi:hypothetical protein